MSFFDSITIQDFKNYYEITGSFNFNEFPKWDASVTYSLDNKTYYTNYKIYTSLQGSNLNNIPKMTPSFWSEDNQDLYPFIVFDEFITKALTDAKSTISFVFNKMKNSDSSKTKSFMLLAGHYLQLILNERIGVDNSAITPAGLISSESANGVSVSFAQTDANNNLFTQFLLQTTQGRQYLELLDAKYVSHPIIVQPINDFSYDYK